MSTQLVNVTSTLTPFVQGKGFAIDNTLPERVWRELLPLCAEVEQTHLFQIADLARVARDAYHWPYADIRDLIATYNLHYAAKTLRNYARIARAVPLAERIYSAHITIHHYGVVAHLPSPIRHDLLTQAEKRRLSVEALETLRDSLKHAAPPPDEKDPDWSKATLLQTVRPHPLLRSLHVPNVDLNEPGWEGLTAYIPDDKRAGLMAGDLQMHIEFYEVIPLEEEQHTHEQ